MLRRGAWAWFMVLLLCSGSGVLGGDQAQLRPGSDRNLDWSYKDINASRKEGKPILLYVYDAATMEQKLRNVAAEYFQGVVFPCDETKEAVKGFLTVKISVDDARWPDLYRRLATRSAALIVMTGDATPVAAFGLANLPKEVKRRGKAVFPDLFRAFEAALQLNPAVQEKMKANPPKEYVPPVSPAPEVHEIAKAADDSSQRLSEAVAATPSAKAAASEERKRAAIVEADE